MKLKIRFTSGKEIIIHNYKVKSVEEFILTKLNNENGMVDWYGIQSNPFINVRNIEIIEEIK